MWVPLLFPTAAKFLIYSPSYIVVSFSVIMKDHTLMAPVLMFNQTCAQYVTDQHSLLHCGLKKNGVWKRKKNVYGNQDSVCMSSDASFMTELPRTAADHVTKKLHASNLVTFVMCVGYSSKCYYI